MIVSKQEIVLKGNGVAPGIALGQALKLDSHNRIVPRLFIQEQRVEDEVARVDRAIQSSKEQLVVLKTSLQEKVGHEHSFILDVHLLMLEDRILVAEIIELIRRHRANAEWAVRHATDRIRRAYESLDDQYFRERGSDIEYVVERILHNLSGNRPVDWAPLPDELVIVAHDFNPSTFASIDLQKLKGLALESGGRTSHTAIIARGLRIPAVMELRGSLSSIVSGDLLLINGDEGELVVNPGPERLAAARARQEQDRAALAQSPALVNGARGTKDGTAVILQANTELPSEVAGARSFGAEGIGLFRSEFLFFGHPDGLPSMQEQLETYETLARAMHPYPVAVRTLDAGADKLMAATDSPSVNPSMGLRGIRLSLSASERLLVPQLEAILRASAAGNLEIVLPMVSTVEEVWQVRATLDRIRAAISAAGGSMADSVPVGAMVEVPAAVLSLESIAAAVDFLCVGTNDLIQYLLAVDRGNPEVSHLFQPLHPSVLQCLSRIAAVSASLNKPVRICGEMSSNPFFAALLLGMGFRQLSMSSASIPLIRRAIARLKLDDCRRIAGGATRAVTAREAGEYLVAEVSRLVDLDLSAYVREVLGG